MIFFETNKNKKLSLIVLTSLFMAFIVWQWWQLKPWQNEANSNNVSPTDWSQINNTKSELKNSWELGKLELEKLSQALKRQQQEAEILSVTKDYLNNLSSSTVSTTTSTTTSE